jgi:hypothetical protein
MIMNNQNSNYGKLNALAQLVCYRLDELFDKLEIDIRKTGKLYMGCCPVHGGDNYSALNLYPEGDKAPGIWFCKTKKCEKVFEKTIIGFVRGVLSHKYLGWERSDGEVKNIQPFVKVIEWLCKFVGVAWEDLKIDEVQAERHRFATQIASFRSETEKHQGISREKVRSTLQIPAKYYLNRGYSEKILDEYDIGLCIQKDKEMYGRVVVPIYDNKRQFMVACTGRSIFEKCSRCTLYHNYADNCPSKSYSKRFAKWCHAGNTGCRPRRCMET